MIGPRAQLAPAPNGSRSAWSAHCVWVDNPFAASQRRVEALAEPRPLAALVPAALAREPVILIRNGAPVLRAHWHETLAHGDVVAVVVLPRGGGGDGGKNPLRIVLTLAIAVVAPQLVALTGATGTLARVLTAGVNIAGAALVNALIPPPRPPSPQQAAALAAPSPTYTLAAQGNSARIDAPIPVQYGRLMCFPDMAAQPYAEFAGNEQYLYQLLCIGQGEYQIEAIRIEDTPIESFEEVTVEVVPPHTAPTLFPAQVLTSGEVSGQEMATGAWLPATGGFVANSAGTTATGLGLDFVAPRGLYQAHPTSGELMAVSVVFEVWTRAIDASGAPIGGWTLLGEQTWSARTTTPQRASWRYTVAPGRYEVRVRRTDTRQTGSLWGHDLAWSGLRAYLPQTSDYGPVTLVALRLRASNQLSMQAARKINVIATRKLPVWTGTAWSAPQPTRSIAWALADAARNTVYGGRLADTRIDLAGLSALDALWASRGDQFDGRFDAALTLWEALARIAAAGRAKPYLQGGVLRVARDGPAAVPVALFSGRNIVRGSFSIDYRLPAEDTADAVEVGYFDADVWAPRRVLAQIAGGGAARPAKVDLFGVTSRAQAWREGIYQAAANRYRRRTVRFGTEMEGFIPSIGDLIAIAHDMPAWGQHAEAVAWDAATRTLTLSEPLAWSAGTHYLALRTADGALEGPHRVTAGALATQAVFDAAPPTTPYTGPDRERTHVAFGPGETWRAPARVTGVRPRGLDTVEIEAVVEDPAVHTAEQGLTPPPARYSQLPALFTAPSVANLTLASSPADPAQALVSWTPAPGAERYEIEMAPGIDPLAPSTAWTRVGETRAANYSVTALYGAQTMIRVRAVGLAAGPWVTLWYGAVADYMWTSDAALMWNANGATLMWRY